jgi:hypothetical protein
VKFLVRTGLATGIVVVALILTSALWAEYSARNSCASVGSPAASPHRANTSPVTLVDEALPGYQIAEKHSIFVEATPERVFDSLERDTGNEHPVLELFDLLKVFGDQGASSLAEADKPVLDWLRSDGESVLEEPGREVVLVNGDTAVVSFRVDPEDGGSRLTTETRIMFADRNLCHDYCWYWDVIYPGSSLLRIDFMRSSNIGRRQRCRRTLEASIWKPL